MMMTSHSSIEEWFRILLNERKQLLDQVTELQVRCTELVEANREFKEKCLMKCCEQPVKCTVCLKRKKLIGRDFYGPSYLWPGELS